MPTGPWGGSNLFRRYWVIFTPAVTPEWSELLGESVIAAATLDRLLHHSHVLNIRGEIYRLRDKRQAGIFPSHQLLMPGPDPANNQSTQPQVGQI